MTNSKSKDLQRSELKSAIEAFISGGGRITKLEILDSKEADVYRTPVDLLEPISENPDHFGGMVSRIVKPEIFDY